MWLLIIALAIFAAVMVYYYYFVLTPRQQQVEANRAVRRQTPDGRRFVEVRTTDEPTERYWTRVETDGEQGQLRTLAELKALLEERQLEPIELK